MATKPIELDLRRDLPKVRRRVNYADMGECKYASPCAIGAMIDDARKRRRLDSSTTLLNDSVHKLVADGKITMPPEQIRDAVSLQRAFDSDPRDEFDALLAKLEAKYLTA